MCGPVSSGRHEPSDIDPGFIKEIEDEISGRLGRRVTLALGDGIIAVRINDGLPTGESVVVMGVGPLLSRKQPEEWADVLERKISGRASPGRLSGRAGDVEHLFTEIQQSPTPQRTGAFVLEHVDDYDDEFFEALAQIIARHKVQRRMDRVRKFEALDEYLREVRRRAAAGETAQMWRELAQGTAQENQEKRHVNRARTGRAGGGQASRRTSL
jgi:hypothetical protein